MRMYREMSGVPQLPANTLFDVRLKKDQARQRAYNQILEQALQKVAHSAMAPNQPTFVYYNIPPFVLGLPALDMKDCVVYIVYQLRLQGYDVRYTYPNLLWISWAHHERQYLMEKNPIIQSMMPSKKGVLKPASGPPTMLGPEKRSGSSAVFLRDAFGGQNPLKAADYTPPSDFMETMERPSPYTKPKQTVRFTESKDALGNVLDELWKI
jgi:hypothetical protein